MRSLESPHPVAVLGAGAVGLAAAAHLVARGLTALVLEAGHDVAATFRSVAHVRLFSPWRFIVDLEARRLLESTGWRAPDDNALPTAGEVVARYLEPLAAHPAVRSRLRLGARVYSVTRQGLDKVTTAGRAGAPFVVRAIEGGRSREYLASAVLDATGTWQQPNPAGAGGWPAIGEREAAGRITYGMPDIAGAWRHRFLGRRVLVLGAGHSAAGNLLALGALADDDPGTEIVWALRGSSFPRSLGGGERDGLPARGRLGLDVRRLAETGRLETVMNFRLQEIRTDGGRLLAIGVPHAGRTPVVTGLDEIVVATGARPDLSVTRELRLALDPWLESAAALAPLIDPNIHGCGTVPPHGHRELAHPEPGFFIVGAKSYGRAPNFLLATGYEQVRSVVAALAGDLAAADDVRLELPETGVCVTDPEPAGAARCCGDSRVGHRSGAPGPPVPCCPGAGDRAARPPTAASADTAGPARCCWPPVDAPGGQRCDDNREPEGKAPGAVRAVAVAPCCDA